jgi:predicted aspartyl protease
MFLDDLTGVMDMTCARAKRIAVLWLLCCSAVLAAGTQINGTVLDSEGAAITKAHVIIRADASGKQELTKNSTLTIETDKEGHFSASASIGFHDVCMMADAFSPQCLKVFVRRENVALKISLKADPEVMKRLGDKF